MNIQKMILLLVAGIAFASCTSPKQNKASEGSEVEVSASTTTESKKQIDLLLNDQNGQVLSVSSLKGKVVFINFWATWCPPCIKELPSINKLKNNFQDNEDMVFLMVDVDNRIEQATTFMRDNNFDLPVYVASADIPREYLGDAIPTTVVLNKTGELVARIEGGRDYASQEIIQALQDLLAEE